MIDNYDSFTYNLVQLFGILGVTEMTIWRNDAITLDELIAYAPDVLVVSPGPCSPTEAGISVPAIAHFISHIPILGVCLGHQSLVHALGGEIVRADRLMHGKTSPVFHDNKGLYADVRNPFEATRYHSLLAQPSSLPAELQVSAKTWEDEIMGVRHTTFPVYGVQYHPESILTVQGRTIVGNFIRIAQAFYRAEQPREGDNDHVAA
ncbi:MAG: aminodeoxychorismate/anthranilate synthase component II [Myxococcota bacterium]